MAELRTGQPKIAQQLFDYVAMLKVKDGLSDNEIRQRLDARGVKTEVADLLLKKANQFRSAHLRAAGLKNAVIGAAILLIGIVVVLSTVSPVAELGGGTRASIFIAYGAIGFGVFELLHGVIQLVQGIWTRD